MAIITISREMGTGGTTITHKVAEQMGYTLVDGEAIAKVADRYGLTPEVLATVDEKPPAFVEELDEKIEVDMRLIELIVLEFALRGDVIIYGRGGQDLLKDIDNVFRVRITAPKEQRIERWAEREWIDPDQAALLIRRSDQQRAGFIKYYFDRDWLDPLGYDLTINTHRLSEEMAVELICRGVHDQNLQERRDSSKKVLADLIISKKAEISILSALKTDGHHVKATTSAGVLTLNGHVDSRDKEKIALAAVADVDGVSRLVNKLSIVCSPTPY